MTAIPYMGSKRKLAPQIVDYMIQCNPAADTYYDLFGGGGAITFELLRRGKRVVYNELNTGVVRLLEKLRNDGITNEFYRWVDRDEFNAHKNDDTWYGGFLATCWSFGNNQKDYLYGKNIAKSKQLLHEIIVNKCSASRDIYADSTGILIDDHYLQNDDIQKRRLAVMGVVKGVIGMAQVEHLQRLQHLTNIQRLERLPNFEIQNKSYDEVVIETPIETTVIYLDPPYFQTKKYKEDICHDALNEYIKRSPYKIYVSSYEFDLPCVLEMKHKSTLSATNNSKNVVEKLFCNRDEAGIGGLFC